MYSEQWTPNIEALYCSIHWITNPEHSAADSTWQIQIEKITAKKILIHSFAPFTSYLLFLQIIWFSEWSESFNVFFCLLLLLHLCFFFLFLVFLVSRCVSCLPYYYLCCYQFLFPPYFIENTLKLITMIQFGSCAPSHWTVCVCKCVSFVFVTSLLSYNESVHCLHLNRWLGYQW